jgi:signal transduction histidine kinase
MQDLLSKVSRYEALFELTGVINAAGDIESVGDVLARRLKYITDVYSWRYVCFDGDPEENREREPAAIIIDGYQGRAEVTRTSPDALSNLERELWRDRKTRILSGDPMSEALESLPVPFRRDDIKQISVNTLVENGRTQALHLFCKRRQPFVDLDLKCLSMVCGFFHRKVHMLWEQQKLRDLELAYLKQEIMLRQSEKLATLGRLSAGMAHELNNPAAAARQGIEHLRSTMARTGSAQYALGAAGLSDSQHGRIAQLRKQTGKRERKPESLTPLARSDLEQEVENWLARIGMEDPWDHAPTLVTMGVDAAEREDLLGTFGPRVTPLVIDYLTSRFAAHTLLDEIGDGTRRISEIVKALKGYSFMDQAPVQAVDVCEGLNDTLVMLGGSLRNGIDVDLDFAADLPRIQGYGSELNQVWTNLIENAIGAMDGRGALGLKAYRHDDWVVVEVADTGPGIPAEAQKKIFDPFFTTKAPGEGTGMGLNISHGIVVEKHNGQILVESKPGATRFTVRLPITGDLPAGEDKDIAEEEKHET